MGLRAPLIMFLPGMTYNIERHRESYLDCVKNVPSQPPLPTAPSSPPATPFEQTYADFFDCAGKHYLVVREVIHCHLQLGVADTDTVKDPSDASPRPCRKKRPLRRYVSETEKWHYSLTSSNRRGMEYNEFNLISSYC